jgi:hypothetical protein
MAVWCGWAQASLLDRPADPNSGACQRQFNFDFNFDFELKGG